MPLKSGLVDVAAAGAEGERIGDSYGPRHPKGHFGRSFRCPRPCQPALRDTSAFPVSAEFYFHLRRLQASNFGAIALPISACGCTACPCHEASGYLFLGCPKIGLAVRGGRG